MRDDSAGRSHCQGRGRAGFAAVRVHKRGDLPMLIEIAKAVLFGIVQGITEWLPISSTGHMILLNEFVTMNMSEKFMEMFFVVVQLGAILAVLVLFGDKLLPFTLRGGFRLKAEALALWPKIVVASIPAGVVGLLWGNELNSLFFTYPVVIVMLALFGVLFIVVENRNKGKAPVVETTADLTYKAALWIGCFQLIAAVFPGTSRSGSTIIGALMIGVSRVAAAEFTFLLAVPIMIGASAVKLLDFGLHFTATEGAVLLTGMVVAFVVSVLAIRFLMSFIKTNDFKVFGWYRIILAAVASLYFFILQ